MIFGIYTNLNRDNEGASCKKLITFLEQLQIEYLICDNSSLYFSPTHTIQDVAKACDMMIVFGGDGTMLEVVGQACKYDKPVLGVNLGHVGFLTEVDYQTIEDAILSILKGNYTIENRAMLCVEIENQQHFAINEILLSNSNNCHISTFEAYVDGVLIDKIRSDGMMVSTATGSTAYSLSCNGPILDPMVKAFIINTICPHSLHSCPMVVSDESKIVINTFNKDMRIIIDGKIIACFDDGISINVQKSDYFAKFIRLSGASFYQKLLKKLSYWGD